MIKIYHNPQWSKSRKSVEILNHRKVKFTIIEYIKTGITESDLSEISKKLNLHPKDFIRKGDKLFKENNIEKYINDDKKLFKEIIKYPKLLERPIIIQNDTAIIARPADLLNNFLL